MPLIQSASPAAFENNFKAELATRPKRQALAIAYSVQRRNKHAEGGGIGGGEAGGIGRAIQDVVHTGGLIDSSIAGRTDRLPLSVPQESHILPADVVSGMGQGNTMAGSRILIQALRLGPTDRGRVGFAEGGGVGHIGILAAGGEVVIPHDDWPAEDDVDGQVYLHRGVRSIGDGDTKLGHERLDKMIANVRKHTAHFITHAPPPKT